MQPAIRFQNVSKQYLLGLTRTSVPSMLGARVRNVLRGESGSSERETLWAVRDISFDLNPGESLALVGPNGAGKSTILKLLSKITFATQGDIEVNGRLSALLELGAGFHPDLTGRENIYLNGTILGLSRRFVRSRFDQIVAFSELEKFIDTPLKRYSSGMAVRLGFAVASCIDPDILLIDEVLAVGDSQFRQKCMNRIQQLVENGTSIIFVSHNLYMVQAVCRKALYIQKGAVKHEGDVISVIQEYEADIHRERAESFDRGATVQAANADAPAFIKKVEVGREFSSVGETLTSEDPATVRIRYKCQTDAADLNIAIFLIRSDGVTCAMIRSKVDGFPVRFTRGEGVVDVRIDPLQLITGTYFAEVELTDPADSMVIHSHPARSDWFEVNGRTRAYDSRTGVFEANASWRMLSPEEADPQAALVRAEAPAEARG